MKATDFIVPILIYIFSLMLLTGKANFLIAGYNTASKEEKERINSKVLSKVMSLLMFVLGTMSLLIIICERYNNEKLKEIFCTITFVVVILAIIYINKSKKINL